MAESPIGRKWLFYYINAQITERNVEEKSVCVCDSVTKRPKHTCEYTGSVIWLSQIHKGWQCHWKHTRCSHFKQREKPLTSVPLCRPPVITAAWLLLFSCLSLHYVSSRNFTFSVCCLCCWMTRGSYNFPDMASGKGEHTRHICNVRQITRHIPNSTLHCNAMWVMSM